MTTVKMRQKVVDYITNADDRIVKAVYAMLKEYEESPSEKSALSEKQYQDIENRWKKYNGGKSKRYTIEEVRQRLQK